MISIIVLLLLSILMFFSKNMLKLGYYISLIAGVTAFTQSIYSQIFLLDVILAIIFYFDAIDINISNKYISRGFWRFGYTGTIFLSSSFILLVIGFFIPIYLYIFLLLILLNLINSIRIERGIFYGFKTLYSDEVSCYRDESEKFIVRVENKSKHKITVNYLDSDDKFRIMCSVASFTLSPGEYKNMKCRVYGYRSGNYKYSFKLGIMDSSELIYRNIEYKVSVTVYPKVSKASHVARILLSRGDFRHREELIEYLTGSGGYTSLYTVLHGVSKNYQGEYDGCREFFQGDDTKYIHVKKSIEKGKLIIKEFIGSGTLLPTISVDISTYSPDELDDILYDTLILLISSILMNISSISLVIYNSRKIIYRASPKDVMLVLKEVLEALPNISLEHIYDHPILDPPQIDLLSSLKDSYASLEYEILKMRFKETILYDLLIWLSNLKPRSNEIIVLTRNSYLVNYYPMLKYYSDKLGFKLSFFERGL